MFNSNLIDFTLSLPDRSEYTREDLLVEAVKIDEHPSQSLIVYDAPVGWINRHARIALIGVTPGFTQMEIFYRTVRRHLLAGVNFEDACRMAKYEGSFGGSMRTNLVRMLDELGLGRMLGVGSAAELFGPAARLLHTTSAVRYPTFVKGRNYTGSQPPLARSAFLMRYVREVLAPELCSLESAAFVPLGSSVAAALELLEREGLVPPGRALFGFPHPSGANGHRKKQFESARAELGQRLRTALT